MAKESSTEKKVDRRSTRWDAHRNQRREELLDLAHEAVRKYGPLVSMDQIAEVSQTSKSIIYRYFTDKHGLQSALGERMLSDIMARFHEFDIKTMGIDEVVGSIIDIIVGFADEEPGLYVFARIPEIEGEPGAEHLLNFDFLANALIDEHGDVEGIGQLRGLLGYQRGFAIGIASIIRGITDAWMAAREFIKHQDRFEGRTIDAPAYELGMFSKTEVSALLCATIIPSFHAMMSDSLDVLVDMQPNLVRFESGKYPNFVTK